MKCQGTEQGQDLGSLCAGPPRLLQTSPIASLTFSCLAGLCLLGVRMGSYSVYVYVSLTSVTHVMFERIPLSLPSAGIVRFHGCVVFHCMNTVMSFIYYVLYGHWCCFQFSCLIDKVV